MRGFTLIMYAFWHIFACSWPFIDLLFIINVELCSDWLFQWGSMLSSALIGCFTVRLISVAHRKETQGGKYIFQYFLAQLYYLSMICHFLCCPRLFLHNTCRTSDDSAGLEHGRVYANVRGVTISDVTVSVMFWFVYFSVVFFINEINIRRSKQWCLRLTVCHFHTALLLFNYAKINTAFHSMAPLMICTWSWAFMEERKRTAGKGTE